MRISIMFAAAAACLTAPAWAGGDGEDKDNQVVCRRSAEYETGTRLRRAPRVCHTRAEWRELERSIDNGDSDLMARRGPRVETRSSTGMGAPQ